jgi:CBS domain-containing protein
MQSTVLAADADWSLDMLTDFLVDNSISGAPVTTNGDELVGVVSLTDIVRQNKAQDNNMEPDNTHDVYLYELERQIGREELKIFHTQYESPVRVRDIMTPMIFSVTPDTSLQEVAETMLRGRIHRVFVTSGTKLTGIATTLDVLQVIRDI